MPGRRYTRGAGLGSLVLLVLVAIVVFGDGGDEARDTGRAEGGRAQAGDAGYAGGGRKPGPGVPARVTRVVDGDTVEVLIAGREEDVRYIGVDTPETVKPGEPVQCFGPQASAFNHRLVEGRRVRLVFDAERRDFYGRLLAYVYLRGELVNARLVRRGYARTLTIEPNDTYAALFVRLQRLAGREGRGLWDACSP
ncbi:MAG: thermonuclease family protein [Actinomycetota bacterium]